MKTSDALKLQEKIHGLSIPQVVDAYVHIHQTIKGLEEKKAFFRKEIETILKNEGLEGLEGKKGSIAMQDGRKMFDSKAFREDHPELWEEYQTIGSPFLKVKVAK